MAAVLVDAGAFIALLDRSDEHHQDVSAALDSVDGPLVTVWPAVSEAMHFLARIPRAQAALFDLIDDDGVSVAELGQADLRRMKVLMNKYRDLPMDFADAALVRLAERERLTRILTFDQDFRVYSLPGRARFVLLGLPESAG